MRSEFGIASDGTDCDGVVRSTAGMFGSGKIEPVPLAPTVGSCCHGGM